MRVDREKRRRADGTEIDSVKNLADYVQSFPISGESDDAPEVVAAPVIPIAPVVAQPDTNAELERLREESKRSREEAQRYQAELAGHKTRQEAEAAARRVLAEQQQRPAVPQAPAVDPRYKQVDDNWFTDPSKARALLQEIQRDERKAEFEQQRATMKQEVFTELTAKQQSEQSNVAYAGAMLKLQQMGVRPEDITGDRVVGVYSAITRKPTAKSPNPHYDAGGPLNEAVIVQAWKNMYGIPNGGDAGAGQGAGVGAPAPVAAPTPVPVAPPGSSRPAPAATPPRQPSDRQPALSANDQRDIDHMAKTFGYDADKMKARRRDRLSRERG